MENCQYRPASQILAHYHLTFCLKAKNYHHIKPTSSMLLVLKDVRGWQFLTMKAAETLCIVCLPPEEHNS